ncbi:hypothetical protein BH39T_PBIAJDOK_03376 [Barrientosiimonas humi]|nr:hypothetical protein BH39T_PBIAJDOK_03376 [Barrientosiimonas humi]
MAYGVWAAVGVALTALVSRVVFREPFSGLMAAASPSSPEGCC